jgi:hypothetical protein
MLPNNLYPIPQREPLIRISEAKFLGFCNIHHFLIDRVPFRKAEICRGLLAKKFHFSGSTRNMASANCSETFISRK